MEPIPEVGKFRSTVDWQGAGRGEGDPCAFLNRLS